MPRKAPVVSMPPTKERICCFCGLKDDNELDYGKFHEYDGIITHYYCLLFSSNMQQKGQDDEGILGFLSGDINKELKRGRKLACCYCKKMGATLGCCNTKCKKIFHFPCGLKAGSLHQYFEEFRSYCVNHRPKQNIDDRVLKEVSQRDNKICYICYDEVNPRDNLGTLWAPCCKKNAWFHRTCVQQLAISAGYFFKCPLCNNKIEFQRAMLDHGIFIPSQDASWELVPNAFQELLYRHNRCDAEECLCPKGREHTSTNAKWELTLCRTCGSQGIHMACGNLKWVKPIWECTECDSILNKSVTAGCSEMSMVSRVSGIARVLRRDKGLLTDDESSSDSDISVGGFPEIPMEATIGSQSSSYVSRRAISEEREESPDKIASLDDRQHHIVPLKSRRNSITQNHETREIHQSSNDELPPLTKKPRISDSYVDHNHREADDSDDDIIVISGPSRKENAIVPTNGTQSPATSSVLRSLALKINDKAHQIECKKFGQEDSKIVAEVARTSSGASSEIVKRVPVEIDLSDSESASMSSLSSVTNAESTANVIPDIPEFNIKITNVTSLAPEAFASVPEYEDRTISDSTIQQSRAIDHLGEQNPRGCVTQQTHEQLQIVRFDGARDPNNPINSVLYGLTIPGTNNTVPLIISSPDNTKSPTSPASQELWNTSLLQASPSKNMSPLPSPIKNLAGPKSRKAAIQAAAALKKAVCEAAARSTKDRSILISPSLNVSAIHSNEITANSTIQSNEKLNNSIIRINDKSSTSVTSKLSYSIPLETVVNDQILLSRSSNNSPSVKTTGSPSKLTNTVTISIPQGDSTKSNSVNSSPDQKAPLPVASVNNTVLNGDFSSPVPQFYAFMKTGSFSPSKTSSNTPNGLVASRIPQISGFPVGQGNNVAPNGFTSANPIVTSMNTAWPMNGTAGSISMANVNGNLKTTGYGSSANVQIQKTSSISNEMELLIIPSDSNGQVSSENFDGDAGSGPAVQPTSDITTDTKSKRIVTTSTSQLIAATDNRDRSNVDGKIESAQNDAQHVAQKYDTAERPTTSDRGNPSDRTGLMNKTMNLRDLRFTVCGSKIVKMTLYETYFVNINVDTGSKRKYVTRERSHLSRENSSDSFTERTNRSSCTRGNDALKNVNSDSADLPSSLTNSSTIGIIGSRDDEISNQSTVYSRSNVATAETETPTNELSPADASSRGQDELKENLDPVPPTTNLNHNTASSIERKSKSRLRSGVNIHTIQLLNERETQETVDDENAKGSPRKLVNHDQLLVTSPSKISYNGWKENAGTLTRALVVSTEEETNTRKMSPERLGENIAPRAAPRVSTIDENSTSEISDHSEASVKRPKYIKDGIFPESQDRDNIGAKNDLKSDSFTTTTTSHLVSNAERSQSRNSPCVNVCKSVKSKVSNASKERKRTSHPKKVNGESSVCCKVSIDLARIRSVLTSKLNSSNKPSDCKSNEGMSASHFDNKNKRKDLFYSKSFQNNVPRKSRSLDNLAINDCSSSVCRVYNVKTRRWKSTGNLDGPSLGSGCEDTVNGFCTIFVDETKRRGCKRKTRSFEKHDCVR